MVNFYFYQSRIFDDVIHMFTIDLAGLEIERLLGVRKVAGSIPSRDIPKVVKKWYKQLP